MRNVTFPTPCWMTGPGETRYLEDTKSGTVLSSSTTIMALIWEQVSVKLIIVVCKEACMMVRWYETMLSDRGGMYLEARTQNEWSMKRVLKMNQWERLNSRANSAAPLQRSPSQYYAPNSQQCCTSTLILAIFLQCKIKSLFTRVS